MNQFRIRKKLPVRRMIALFLLICMMARVFTSARGEDLPDEPLAGGMALEDAGQEMGKKQQGSPICSLEDAAEDGSQEFLQEAYDVGIQENTDATTDVPGEGTDGGPAAGQADMGSSGGPDAGAPAQQVQESQAQESQTQEPQMQESQAQEPQMQESQAQEAQAPDQKTQEQPTMDRKDASSASVLDQPAAENTDLIEDPGNAAGQAPDAMEGGEEGASGKENGEPSMGQNSSIGTALTAAPADGGSSETDHQGGEAMQDASEPDAGSQNGGEVLAGPVELNGIETDARSKDDGSGEECRNPADVAEDTDGKQDGEEESYGYEQSMTLEALAQLPQEEAGAATQVLGYEEGKRKKGKRLASADPGRQLWTCSDYYVNEPDLHNVSKTDDFSLKYQVEFHASTNLEEGCVEIRIPEALLADRMGNPVIPSQIGVPGGTRESPSQSLNSPFNWYRDEAQGMIVFFNFRKIVSGTNTAFQVLYHPVRILDIVDGSAWSLTPHAYVTLQDAGTQDREMDTLTGCVDSHAQLLGASADAFSDGSIRCMPALYTRDQVRRVLGAEPPSFVSGNEDEWMFLAWKIDSQGQYNQPWSLQIDADLLAEGLTASGDLCVVGSVTKVMGSENGSGSQGKIVRYQAGEENSFCIAKLSSEDLSQFVKQGMFRLTTITVTAVRKSCLKAHDSVLGLKASVKLTPADGRDPVTESAAQASWTFVDYQWKYQGDDVGIKAWTGSAAQNDTVSYSQKEETMNGWINEYRMAQTLSEEAGAVPFRIRSECRGYSYTHETGGPSAGSYKAGTGYEVTTADDVVYLAGITQENGALQVLGPQDYYYSSVSVTIKDRGMDLFEDKICAPMAEDKCPGADRSTEIYALYEDSAGWELVSSCPWNSSGKISYSFSKEQLARKVWRVKVVHHAVDYDSSCTIDSALCLRNSSPVLTGLLGSEEDGSACVIKAEHLGSVLARSTGTSADGWFHDTRENIYENYSEPGLAELTGSLYGIPSMRANSFATLTEWKKHARALKTAGRENDPEHGCVSLTYTIGALEGYLVYSQEAARRLSRGSQFQSAPDRTEYMIYDLLPEGVVFDPSVTMKAGLVMGTEDRHLVKPSLWDMQDVRAKIDPSSGIRSNWRDTGRTLLAIHVSIARDAELIPRMYREMWMNGIGVQFGCTCPYRDLKTMNAMPNIAAVMSVPSPDNPACQILGAEDEVACDDGNVVPYEGEEREALGVFGADIDGDGITDLRNVLYAMALSSADTAVSLTDGIDLTVKSDREEFTDGARTAVIGQGDPYTYRIDVANTSSQPISELVICSHLEMGKQEREDAEIGRIFDEQTWQGFLESVDTKALSRRQIAPVIWLSLDPLSPFPEEGKSPDSILTHENGWIRMEDWNRDMGEVRSVAVDLRKKTDGSSFILDMGDSVHLFLHMQGPGIGEGEGETTAEHAYHCASFYSISEDEPDGDIVQGNAVEVSLKKKAVLIAEKILTNPAEDGSRKESFLFRLTRNGEPAALHQFRLEEKETDESGIQAWRRDDTLHTTMKDGIFSLRSGQRAVFENEPGGEELEVEEVLPACYEAVVTQEETQEGMVHRFENTWYPTLFLTKKILGVPEDTSIPEDVFRVKVTAGGKSLKGMPYWSIDPENALMENQILEERIIDEDSCVLLRAGEVIALHPGEEGVPYEVTEDASCYGEQSDYVGVTTTMAGLLGPEASYVTLENAWKWKELVLRKEVLHQDAAACAQPFTFRLWKVRDSSDAASFDPADPSLTSDPVAGVEGTMEDTSFVTDENGCFTLMCAGKDAVLKHLQAGKTYVVQEVDLPEDYEAVNQGIQAAAMPLLGSRRFVTIQNSWKKRSLCVTKTVLAGTHQNRTTVCTPGYPGMFPAGNGTVTLFSCAPEGMAGFTVTFPRRIDLSRNERLYVISANQRIDYFTGVIEAGTSKTYTGYSQASFQLWGMSKAMNEGLFFFFSPAFPEEASPGEDASGKTFSFLLETAAPGQEMEAVPDALFLTSDGQEGRTDADGRFSLSAGMSATFPDIAEEGSEWRVTEMPDPSCPQAYPAGGKPQSGVFGEGGEDLSRALFINGQSCQGMFRKQYCAMPGDEAAERYLTEQRNCQGASSLKSVFLVEVSDDSGAFVPYSGMLEIADASEGALLRCEIPDGLICIGEGQTVILSGLAPNGLWRVTETRNGLVIQDHIVYGTACLSPGEGRQMSADPSREVSDMVFVNEIHSVDMGEESLVRKDLLSSSDGWERVPEGAVLAFCLERYSQGAWHAAGGVDWIQVNGGIPVQSALNQTGEDGIIRVKKESPQAGGGVNGQWVFPIAISDGRVRTQLYYLTHEAQEGDLLIREALDLSDPSYGMLVRCEGNTFINENDMQTLVVEKQTDVKADQPFRFRIRQQVGDDLFSPGRIAFRIRDPQSGEDMGGDTTDAQGAFSLYSASQAVFRLPQGTRWEVTEENTGNWKLVSCTMENAVTDPAHTPGGMLFEIPPVRHNVVLTSKLLKETLTDPATGQVLNLKGRQVRIPHYIKRGDEILEITQIDDQLFSNSSIQSVYIEDGIRKIGNRAFYQCIFLSSVRLPETLEEFGNRCFVLTNLASLEIPASVRKTGSGIVANCSRLKEIIIHQKEEESPFSGYEWNNSQDIHVVFSGES